MSGFSLVLFLAFCSMLGIWLLYMYKYHEKYKNAYRYVGKHKWFVQGLTIILQPIMEIEFNFFGKKFGLRSKITHGPHWKNIPLYYFDSFTGTKVTGIEDKTRRDMGIFGVKVLPKTIFVEFTEERRVVLIPKDENIEWCLGFKIRNCCQVSKLWHKGSVQIMYDGGDVTLYGIDKEGKEVLLREEKKHYSQTQGMLYI